MKDTLKAEDVMKSPVLSVNREAPLTEAMQLMSDNRISGLLVTDDRGEPVGVVSLLDIVSAVAGLERAPGEPGAFYRFGYPKFAEGGEGWENEWEEIEQEPLRETTVGEIMSPEIISVKPRTPVPQVARMLSTRRIHRVFVSDGDRPLGVISSLDLLGVFAGSPLAQARR